MSSTRPRGQPSVSASRRSKASFAAASTGGAVTFTRSSAPSGSPISLAEARGYIDRALEKAREQGLPRVMLTIEGENLASARVIEKNGGKLEWQRQESESGETLACYWIEL